MRTLILILGTFSLLASTGCGAPTEKLFNGRDFSGWEFVTPPATPADINTVCKFSPEGVLTAAGNPVGYIATLATYKNYRMHAEYRWTEKAGNGGILIHLNATAEDKGWPLSQQVQMKTKSVGDLMPMTGATFLEPLEPSPKNPRKPHIAPDSEKPAGEWNVCDVVCRDGTIEVTINGVLQNKVSESKPAAGRIGFQFEGAPFELRNVRLEPID